MKLRINPSNEKEIIIDFANHDEYDSVKMNFSVKKRSHRFMQTKYGKWNGVVNFLRKERFAPIQLWQKLYSICKANNYEFDYEEIKPYIRLKVNKKRLKEIYIKCVEADPNIEYDEDQFDSIYQMLKWKHNKMNLSVSYGKTLVFYVMCAYLVLEENEKILVINPKPNLNQQMFAEFVTYSNVFTDMAGRFMFTSSGQQMESYRHYDVCITNFQYAWNKEDECFEHYTSVMVDEVHRASSKSFKIILEKCVNVRSTRGATGTMVNDHSLENYATICASGFTNKIVQKRDIISKGRATDGIIITKFIEPLQHGEGAQLRAFYRKEEDHLTRLNLERRMIRESDERLLFVINDSISTLKQYGGNTVVFFKDVKNQYGRKIFEGITNKGITTFYIDQHVKNRTEIFEYLRNNSGCILVCSYDIISTGVSIRTLNSGYMAEPTKSATTIGQTIGRFMRTHDDKDKFYLVDLVDIIPEIPKMNYYQKWYVYERLKSYKADEFEIVTEKVVLNSGKLF